MDKDKKVKLKNKEWGIFAFVIALVVGLSIIIGVNVSVDNKLVLDKDNQQNVATSTESIEFVMPVEGGVLLKDYSNTKLKYNATLKQWEAHKGVDISAKEGTKVVSVLDGTVTGIENTHLKGTTVTITHKDGLVTTYSSLDKEIDVKLNDNVKRSQVIGKVSTSAKGESGDGPHIHFEVIKDGVKVDPNLYLNFGNK